MKSFTLPHLEMDLGLAWKLDNSIQTGIDGNQWERCHQQLKTKFESQVGFFDWPETIKAQELEEIQTLARTLRENFQGVLVCGIGGSHLGAAAILQALRPADREEAFPFFWLNNIDPWAMERAERFVKKYKVATLLISKSGNTTETLSGFFHLSPHLDPKGIVAITDPNSGELRRLARTEHWANLPVPPNIGGRFSVLTAVGLLPLAMGDVNISELLKGAREMRAVLKASSPLENSAYQYAYTKYFWDSKGHNQHYWMPYHSQLDLLADWYVQLWGESIGKKNKKGLSVGATYISALGTRDQHSLLQLFKEGPANKLIGFGDIRKQSHSVKVGTPPFKSPDFSYLCKHTFGEINSKALYATQQSLNRAAVPTYELAFTELSAAALGAFCFFQETACAFAGELYDIDAFNQPGVEEAKRILRESL